MRRSERHRLRRRLGVRLHRCANDDRFPTLHPVARAAGRPSTLISPDSIQPLEPAARIVGKQRGERLVQALTGARIRDLKRQFDGRSRVMARTILYTSPPSAAARPSAASHARTTRPAPLCSCSSSAIVVAGSAGCRSRGDVAAVPRVAGIHLCDGAQGSAQPEFRERDQEARGARGALSVQRGSEAGAARPAVRVLQEPRGGIGDRSGGPVHPREPDASADRLCLLHQGAGVFRGRRELSRTLLPRRHLEASAAGSAAVVPVLPDPGPAVPEESVCGRRPPADDLSAQPLADYEVAVARYYMKRGAYVGAANRARA